MTVQLVQGRPLFFALILPHLSLRIASRARTSTSCTMPNTICYFDMSIGGQPAGRITFELYDELLPKVSPVSGHSAESTTGAAKGRCESVLTRLRRRTTSSTCAWETRRTQAGAGSHTPGRPSTGASRGSCCKAETLREETEPAERASTARRYVRCRSPCESMRRSAGAVGKPS